MTQYAGQMVAWADDLGSDWVPCEGQLFPHASFPDCDYHQRVGFRSGVIGIYLLRLPDAPGWAVLMRDDPDAPDLPADTPTAGEPPTEPPPEPEPPEHDEAPERDRRSRHLRPRYRR